MASFRVVQTVPTEGNYKQLRVEDALAYLDKVKQQFGSKPQIYNKFLDIMKSFKAQTIDTPGVIKRVSDLFKGHNNLILGFNTFLPPGFKIEIDEAATAASAAAAVVPTVAASRPVAAPAPAPSPSPPPATAVSRKPSAPVRTGPNAGPLEFDHAINYVTKIKRRFANDPQTYKSFLEILHTYQKQQRSIREVLERVSVLFKDHADLLRDFTYFLPDAVQPTAAQRISRAAENARQRETGDKSRTSRGGYEPTPGSGGFEPGAGPAPTAGYGRVPAMGKDRERIRELDREAEREQNARYEHDRAAARDESERDRERGRLLDRARDRLTVGMGPGKSPRMQVVVRRRRGREEEMHLTLTPTERQFFERVKGAIGTREAWVEFLKCLDLYAAEVLTRTELTALLADIFGPQNVKLLEELKQLLNNRGVLEMTAEDVWYSMPIGEIDLSQAVRCTPSYRQLPEGYPLLACSERSKLEREVCNDHWVSVPTGSEDFSFKIMRKNQYEDALFRCEDERYEIDMVIENNMSAIRVLEPLADEIQALKDYTKGIEWQFRLDRRSLGVLHLKAISRVYGEYGNEVLELLRKNPASAIPIILTRLKQKDSEWRKAKTELNKGWKEVMEKNYYKSLDHRSFYFKQHDKKHLASKNLIAEMRSKVEALENAVRDYLQTQQEANAEAERAEGNLAVAADSVAAANGMDLEENVVPAGKTEEKEAALAQPPVPAALRHTLRSLVPEMHFIYRDISVHKDAYALLAYAVEKTAQAADKGAIADLWKSFLLKFFQIPAEWTKNAAADLGAHMPLPLGQIVATPYGVGVVENWKPTQYGGPKSVDKNAPLYCHVMFSWGRGVLSASDVKAVDMQIPEFPGRSAANIMGGADAAGRVKPVNTATKAAGESGPVSVDAVLQKLSGGVPTSAAVEGLDTKEFVAGPAPPAESILYCTATGYVFFRLHQMLVDRLLTARLLCANVSGKGFREFGKPLVPHPADRAADAVANAPGTAAANQGHSHGEMRAAAAAAAGDLTAATAAGVAAGVNPGGIPAVSNAAEKADAGKESARQTYQHFLTALYALIDGTMDSSRFEDECRELMGTGAYLLFTMDKLISSATKQLITMVHESSSVRLRSLWEYTQAKVRLARGTSSAEDAEKSIKATLASYRANVASSMMARGAEEVYCVQYTIDPAEMSVEDIVPETGIEEAGPHHRSSSMSIRFVGKPTYDFNDNSTIRGFQYAAALPAYLSRLVGQGKLIMGDETVDEVEEEIAADDVERTAAKAATRKVPYLARNAVVHGERVSVEANDIGGLAAAANRVGMYANTDVAVTSNLAASIGERGALKFVAGTEESMIRQ